MRGSPIVILIGRWGMALSLVIGAVLLGRVIRNSPSAPQPLPSPRLVLYKLGPALIFTLAIASAIAITDRGRSRPGIPARLALFAGVGTLGIQFDAALRGQWF